MAQVIYTARFGLDQKNEISEARLIRAEATNLRRIASSGSYGDKELVEFWRISSKASVSLLASNPTLGERAGLGAGFFASVSKDRRRPKLTNFLKALTAIIEIADERLFDVDRRTPNGRETARASEINRRIGDDHRQLLVMAAALSELAKGEIGRLDDERPNHPDVIQRNKLQRELLLQLAEGFDKFAEVLRAVERDPAEPVLLGRASKVVEEVSSGLNRWWDKNRDEAVDFVVRIPVFASGVALLGWAGANMTIATSAIAAIVGVPTIAKALKRGKIKR